MLRRQVAAAAVSVGTYWPWETTATLRLLRGARRFGAHRGRRGAGRPTTACSKMSYQVLFIGNLRGRLLHINDGGNAPRKK